MSSLLGIDLVVIKNKITNIFQKFTCTMTKTTTIKCNCSRQLTILNQKSSNGHLHLALISYEMYMYITLINNTKKYIIAFTFTMKKKIICSFISDYINHTVYMSLQIYFMRAARYK